MKYVSTRGLTSDNGFNDILLDGLARDGGLYVPTQWPQMSPGAIADLAGLDFSEAAFRVIKPYIGHAIPADQLLEICRQTYLSFDHPAVAPLTQLAPNRWILELFHGPTLAFKDVAMQLLARLMDYVLGERGERVTIIGATSGDTGAAAIEAYRDRRYADVFILFPEGRVSPIQQRQMTAAAADNVRAVAIKGTFDDCQAIVKSLFGNTAFRERTRLAGVNSINWARILGQITYYFTAAVALGAPHRKISFTVPTGNFGDIYAGYAAKRMGLPIDRLCIATNINDILARTLENGRYDVRQVAATTSPSMDIQLSSNFERLLFSAGGDRHDLVRQGMDGLAQSGAFTVDGRTLETIRRDFTADRASESETAATIRDTYRETGFLADPHTAVGLAVAGRQADPAVPMVTLATAHAAKFPDAVRDATGIDPALPSQLEGIMEKQEHYDTLAADAEIVEDYILARARAVTEGHKS